MNDLIEVEVLEVDGEAPQSHAPAPEPAAAERGGSWQNWQGRVRKLDARWWPLWVVLGVIALFLVLTLGVVLGALFLVVKMVGSVVSVVLRLFGISGSSPGTSLRR